MSQTLNLVPWRWENYAYYFEDDGHQLVVLEPPIKPPSKTSNDLRMELYVSLLEDVFP